MENRGEYLGEELYNLLAEFLNSPSNRHFMDSIRGEYGVLRYLLQGKEDITAGYLGEKLQVVPGRMTDILTALESKGFIERRRNEKDRRVVNVFITDKGREEAERKRQAIHEDYKGLIEILGVDDARELMRLLKILLTYRE